MIVAVIPARGGSKRIPRKNIKDFCKKPLIAYSIEAAIRCNIFDEIIVSTDDLEIANISKQYGAEVPFIRPENLSDDYTGTGAVVAHTVEYLKAQQKDIKFICTIYATAPLIDEKYIVDGYKQLIRSDAKYAFSCTTMPYPIWRTFKVDDNGRCEMFFAKNFNKRSQDLEEAYQDAGQFYWNNLSIKSNENMFGKDSLAIKIPRYLVQDIDTMEDWVRAEYMFEAIKKQNEDTNKSR